MNEVPDVLKPLVETEEEDGSQLKYCDPSCKRERCVIVTVAGMLTDVLRWQSDIEGQGPHFCKCGAFVGWDDRDKPIRVRFSQIVEALEQAQADLAHRDRALAWMAKIVSRYGECPEDECGQCLLLPEEHPVKMARPCDSNPLEIESQCWLALALAATEEKE